MLKVNIYPEKARRGPITWLLPDHEEERLKKELDSLAEPCLDGWTVGEYIITVAQQELDDLDNLVHWLKS